MITTTTKGNKMNTAIGEILIILGVILAMLTAYVHHDGSKYIDYSIERAEQTGFSMYKDISFMKSSLYMSTISGIIISIGFILIGYYLTQGKNK